jgi:hypothetical protein
MANRRIKRGNDKYTRKQKIEILNRHSHASYPKTQISNTAIYLQRIHLDFSIRILAPILNGKTNPKIPFFVLAQSNT